MTELRGALDKEKAERKRENEALENKLESKIVSGRKKDWKRNCERKEKD